MRVHNWSTRLNDYVSAVVDKPFKWGVNDCVTFARGCVHAMTNRDPLADAKLDYDTEEGAFKTIAEYGGGSLELAIVKLSLENHWEEVQINYAQRGDLLSVTTPNGRACGIVALTGRHGMLVGETGLVFVPFNTVKDGMFIERAWRVK
jgi:hypothetical protein